MKRNYCKRIIDSDLLDRSKEVDRKPILLRGERQVGRGN